MSSSNKIVIALLFAAIAALAIFAWKGKSRADDAEGRLGIDAGRVVTAVLTNAADLRVSKLGGQAIARSTNDGRVFSTEQVTKAPFQVSYFVDLRQIGPDDLAWNERNSTMLVRIPDVKVEAPAVDMNKAQIRQKGLWVSRTAGIALQRRATGYLAQAATAKAKSPEILDKVRARAVAEVTEYIRRPLVAAGLRDVRVQVLFPWQGAPTSERWDESKPLAEVLRDGT